eukprot:TRINITY_DN5677_c0_g1_i3.p1 TRINITY_DN5677_c0_g1~~TRINITY_DN5677_c0_g1_i3.p1  ORF type:complete len:377 (+),score=99.09 TRINITY_DN5677_c0_g1_i3:157-1287(+)
MLRSLVGSEMCIRDRSTGGHGFNDMVMAVEPTQLYDRLFDLLDADNCGTLSLDEIGMIFGNPRIRYQFFCELDMDSNCVVDRTEWHIHFERMAERKGAKAPVTAVSAWLRHVEHALAERVGADGELTQDLKSDIKRVTLEFEEWADENHAQKFWNPNQPAAYSWMTPVLEAIVANQAQSLGAKTEDDVGVTPLFAVAGACPSKGMMATPMQAIVYFLSPDDSVRFWWVKPLSTDGTKLSRRSLIATPKGKFKNIAGKAAAGAYTPLANFFQHGGGECAGLSFSIEMVNGSARAVIQKGDCRMWLSLVWQEEWTTSVMARKKFLKGKIVYQRDCNDECFFVRQYEIIGDALEIVDEEEGPFGPRVIPGNVVKHLAKP